MALIIGAVAALSDPKEPQSQERREIPANFSISVIHGSFPTITGTTDLPHKTQIFVNVKKPWLPDAQQRLARGLPACEDDCMPAMGPNRLTGMTVPILNGGFTAGPFSFNGNPFKAGAYTLEISMAVDLNTATVEEIRAMGKSIYAATIAVYPEASRGQPSAPTSQISQPTRQKSEPASRTASASNWKLIEADNGTAYQVDLNSIYRTTDGSSDIVVYQPQGPTFDPRNMRRWYFTCRGYFRVMTDAGLSRPIHVPPRSVAAQIGAIACSEGKGR